MLSPLILTPKAAFSGIAFLSSIVIVVLTLSVRKFSCPADTGVSYMSILLNGINFVS
jgi:hypothetical protein